ncbi:6-phosphofructokinase 1 [Natronincola peptidivorans]|uniref:Pyrophosphate--fructose 6-phosphate 1-phosphotransferase n=1 Tax=Natronincola peptidivorans TaxID=426128 RepID=A0A1I0F2D0_9FIRM|nr:6-phosphofructokinase [Natronincola peptidivorans]SET51959.1 6-phosphofructokinase 1 [Natronincola peptidivorans]
MKNCIVAQSGGPTSVINASVVGVAMANQNTNYYDKVFGGVNGIEGILKGDIINLSELSSEDLQLLKHTPSSGLGSCRYKMKDFKTDDSEYQKLFYILKENDIEAFFYIGGNDSMDTVNKLNQYAILKGYNIQFIGIPKTIDNDLPITDHTPGFGSAAKFIATATLETYLDASVYVNNGIFIIETMGRDTGWLAASAALAKIDNKSVADFIYLPEMPFSQEKFLEDVKKVFQEKNQVYIVVSEGVKNENGDFLCEIKVQNQHDKFGHAQLGGVAQYLRRLIIESGITSRVKTLELGVMQRSAMHCVSETDLEEAYKAGKTAIDYAAEGKTGCMVSFRRLDQQSYGIEMFEGDVSKVANNIKYFPEEWITSEKNHVTEEAIHYIEPLIQGTPEVTMERGLPKYKQLDKQLREIKEY